MKLPEKRIDILVTHDRQFAFGRNWQSFLETLTEERIYQSETALAALLAPQTFCGQNFLDIGSGSGLHSLTARRLGATVYSFDNDADSVECARNLRQRYCPDDDGWQVHGGSVLDEAYMRSLGTFDIVYSWGVLHHTGQMWQALSNAMLPVKDGGLLVVALYNRHWTSPLWKGVKYLYNASPIWLRPAWFWSVGVVKALVAWLTTGEHPRHKMRGMAFRHDLIDWLGGYPYEYATSSEVITMMTASGFRSVKVIPTAGWTGCNQYVFQKR